jgi:hypothetical protein
MGRKLLYTTVYYCILLHTTLYTVYYPAPYTVPGAVSCMDALPSPMLPTVYAHFTVIC